MMTVGEVQNLTGVSVRTLRYYDRIDLLPPAEVSEAGYRLYDDASLARLQQILLFRELQFPLRDIRRILDHPAFDRNRALQQQIELLTLQRDRLDKMIDLARRIQTTGGNTMDFTAFDPSRIEEYARRARESWGDTAAYQEYEKKRAGRDASAERTLAEQMMAHFSAFGRLKDGDPAAPAAQAQARALRSFITEHYYDCTPEIFASLAKMYAAEGEFQQNIDRAGGPGTAAFASAAILAYCERAAGKK